MFFVQSSSSFHVLNDRFHQINSVIFIFHTPPQIFIFFYFFFVKKPVNFLNFSEMKMFLPFIVVLFLLNSIGCNKLEDVSDDDLLHIIKTNEYVAVLFGNYFMNFFFSFCPLNFDLDSKNP